MNSEDVAALEAKLEGLHELMTTKFEHVQERLADVKSALEKLALTAITEQAYLQQIRRVDEVVETLEDHDNRLGQIETPMRILKITGAILSAIIIAVLVALVTGKAHINWQ